MTRTVGVFPEWKHNPYLEDLAEALVPHGYRCVYPDLGPSQLMLYECAKSRTLDLIHLHWQHPFILGRNQLRSAARAARFLLDVTAVRSAGVPVVWTIHNLFSHEGRHGTIERVASAGLYRVVDQPSIHCPHVRSALGEAYWLTEDQCRRAISISHGNYDRAYRSPPAKEEARGALGIDPSSLVYLHFGQVRDYKHVDFIAGAFRRVANPRAILLVAGNCNDQEVHGELRRLSAQDPRIRLLIDGEVPDEDVPGMFAAADVFVYAAFEILMSGAIMLALTYGLPVIAPRVGCLPDVIPEEGVLWYSAHREKELVDALESVSGRDLGRMGESNRAAADRRSWAEIGRRWADVYDRLLARDP